MADGIDTQQTSQIALALAQHTANAVQSLSDRIDLLDLIRITADTWISVPSLPLPPNGVHDWFLDSVPYGLVYNFTAYPLFSFIGDTVEAPSRQIEASHYMLMKGVENVAGVGKYQLHVVVRNRTRFPTVYFIQYTAVPMR